MDGRCLKPVQSFVDNRALLLTERRFIVNTGCWGPEDLLGEAFIGFKNSDIAECVGGHWERTVPKKGDLVLCENTREIYLFEGSYWVCVSLNIYSCLVYFLHTQEGTDTKIIEILDDYYKNGAKNGE